MLNQNRRSTRILFTWAVAVLSSLLAPRVLSAEKVISTPAEQTSLGLTVYNTNLCLVKDVRVVAMPRGLNHLWFEGVAARIDPTSVHILSLDDPNGMTVMEQNFEYDLISPKRLMEKYVGMDLEILRIHQDNTETLKGKLLGTEQGYVYEVDGKIMIDPHAEVILPSLPEGLISKPSLVWMIENERARQTVEASYLTGGISWKADYVAVVNQKDTRADLNAWVTIDNQSGASYADASLKLVAGDINLVTPRAVPTVGMESAVMSVSGRQPFQEESFFEYHLYTLDRKTTVKDKQTKQISLLNASAVGVKKSYVFTSSGHYFYSRMGGPDNSAKVGVYLSLENSKDNNLGVPLPQGVVRVYKKDTSGELQFVGEDRIDHTPEEETVRIKMGNAFDVVAERVQTDFSILKAGKEFESSYSVKIRNHKDEDIVVSVVETMRGDWKVEDSSHRFTRESSHRIRFDVPVKSKGESELVYRVRISI